VVGPVSADLSQQIATSTEAAGAEASDEYVDMPPIEDSDDEDDPRDFEVEESDDEEPADVANSGIRDSDIRASVQASWRVAELGRVGGFRKLESWEFVVFFH
jgi:hypothetical protein